MNAIGVQHVQLKWRGKIRILNKNNQNYSKSSDYQYCLKYQNKMRTILKLK